MLLKDADEKLTQRVEVRIAAAEAWLQHRHATENKTVMDVVRAVSKTLPLTTSQRFRTCPPTGGSHGIATGKLAVEWMSAVWDNKPVTSLRPSLSFGPPRSCSSATYAVYGRIPKPRSTRHSTLCGKSKTLTGVTTSQILDDDGDAAYDHWRGQRDGI